MQQYTKTKQGEYFKIITAYCIGENVQTKIFKWQEKLSYLLISKFLYS
jgi:hypothetical protein